MKKLTLAWFKAAMIRAVKTMAQVAVAMIAVGSKMEDLDWGTIASVALVAGVASLLTSIKGLPETDTEGELIIDSRLPEGYGLASATIPTVKLTNKESIRLTIKKPNTQ